MRLLVHGEPGSGKTSLALTADGPLFYIDTENGRGVIGRAMASGDLPHQIAGQSIATKEDAKKCLERLQSSKAKESLQWVMLDSATFLASRIEAEVFKANDAETFGRGNKRTLHFLTDFLNTLLEMPYHVVVTSQRERRPVGDAAVGNDLLAPHVPAPSQMPEISAFFDHVFAMVVKRTASGAERLLQTEIQNGLYAKCRYGKLDTFEPPRLDNIKQKLFGA